MKKTTLTLMALSMALIAQARILRVSNVVGSSAPYTSIAKAHDAAQKGDTIMVEGSETNYGDILLTKSVVLIGPGFWLTENGLTQEGNQSAKVGILELSAVDITVCGMEITKDVKMNRNNAIINRCKVKGGILIQPNIGHCIIHQNFLSGMISSADYSKKPSFIRITNNIFNWGGSDVNASIQKISNSHIANNTWIKKTFYKKQRNLAWLYACTIENNLLCYIEPQESEGCTFNNNHEFLDRDYYDTTDSPFINCSTDKDIQTTEQELTDGTYGAFSGDDPYVLSGIPAGPVIEKVTLPVTVEQGDKLKVTIKLGVSR